VNGKNEDGSERFSLCDWSSSHGSIIDSTTNPQRDAIHGGSRSPGWNDAACCSPDVPATLLSVRSGSNASRRPTVKISSEYAIAERQHSDADAGFSLRRNRNDAADGIAEPFR
jgi:hypothetical protein